MAFNPARDLIEAANGRTFHTILADPPWRFANRTGKMAPEHRRLSRYATMELNAIKELPVAKIVGEPAHLYLWVPNALLPEGIDVLRAWGFEYKSNIVWHKVRKDGGLMGAESDSTSGTLPSWCCLGCAGRMQEPLRPAGGR